MQNFSWCRNFTLVLSLFTVGASSVGFASESRFHSAVGLGASLTERMSTQNYLTREKAPELSAYGYFPLLPSFFPDFWLRSALRLGYNWSQPEMSDSLRVVENTFRSSVEVGLVYSWVLIPSISVGGGSLVRSVHLETQSPIVSSKMDSGRTDFYPFLQVQAGVGIPLNGGLFVLEPYARSQWVFGDSRYQWAYGFDFSVEIF